MKITKVLGVITIICLLLLCLLWGTVFQMETLYSTKLTPLFPGTNDISITFPQGRKYALVLAGLSKPQLIVQDATQGHRTSAIEVRQGDRTLYHRTLTADSVQECNWLKNYGHPVALILTKTDVEKSQLLEAAITPGQKYDVRIILKGHFTNEVSLWLSRLALPWHN